MANLRQMIDGRTVHSASVAPAGSTASPAIPLPTAGKKLPKPPKQVSPAAQDVAKTMQDPVGETQDQFSDLMRKQLDYNVARENMKRKLLPVQSIVQHVNDLHQLTGDPQNPNDPMNSNMNQDQEDAYQDPNDPNQMNDQPKVGQPGMPGNPMGPAQSKVPPKMGMPAPGSTKAGPPNVPGAGQSNIQTNPAAKKPAGNGSLPGAKGPGDPKVANRNKKAQQNSTGSGRQIKIAVHANVDQGARRNVFASQGFGSLKFGGVTSSADVNAFAMPGGGTRGLPGGGGGINRIGSIRPGGGGTVPVGRSSVSRLNSAKKGKFCKACGKMHAEGACSKKMNARSRTR